MCLPFWLITRLAVTVFGEERGDIIRGFDGYSEYSEYDVMNNNSSGVMNMNNNSLSDFEFALLLGKEYLLPQYVLGKVYTSVFETSFVDTVLDMASLHELFGMLFRTTFRICLASLLRFTPPVYFYCGLRLIWCLQEVGNARKTLSTILFVSLFPWLYPVLSCLFLGGTILFVAACFVFGLVVFPVCASGWFMLGCYTSTETTVETWTRNYLTRVLCCPHLRTYHHFTVRHTPSKHRGMKKLVKKIGYHISHDSHDDIMV